MDTTALADEPAVATDTPPTWSESIAQRFALWMQSNATTAERATGGHDATEAGTPDSTGPADSDSLSLDHRWVLIAPLGGAVVLSAVSWVFDPNPLRTGTAPAGLLAFAALLPFFLVCVAGTLTVLRDAARLRATEANWSPNPWHYVVPSALALAGMHALRTVRRAGGIEEWAGFLAGTLVVALVASSILAGPVYLLQRRRRLAVSDG
jgi:uncharacterized membrane protein